MLIDKKKMAEVIKLQEEYPDYFCKIMSLQKSKNEGK